MERPTYTCDATNKCSEVAGGMAAAMASGAILFQDDAIYSATLLDKAKKIYRYAEEYQGNNGYTAANGFYTSYSGYNDELAWGAVWLYKATGDTAYLDKAKNYVANASDAIYWSFFCCPSSNPFAQSSAIKEAVDEYRREPHWSRNANPPVVLLTPFCQ